MSTWQWIVIFGYVTAIVIFSMYCEMRKQVAGAAVHMANVQLQNSMVQQGLVKEEDIRDPQVEIHNHAQ